MLHEDHGEFILMGTQPLKPSSHDFFISHREQEVSQLTGANTSNCAVDKRWDMEKRGREEEKAKATTASSILKRFYVQSERCVRSLHPAPFYSWRGFYGGDCVNTRMHVKSDES